MRVKRAKTWLKVSLLGRVITIFARLAELLSNIELRLVRSALTEVPGNLKKSEVSRTWIDLAREILVVWVPTEEQFHIPGFEPRTRPVDNTWTYQNEVMSWDIKVGEKVLDIGSGAWPFTKATHLADMHLKDTAHRFEDFKRDNRPVICLDIHHMPFRDKSWDFIFCSHVLEHLERPGDAIREITRVGRCGYIEVPTRLSDVMLNFTRFPEHHRWHCLVLGKTLCLIEWRPEERRDLGSHFFYWCLHSNYSNPFQTYFEENRDIFYATLRWSGDISFLVIDRNGRVIDAS